MSDFEGAIQHGADVKLTSNWLMGGVNEYLNKNQVELQDTQLTPENLAGMIKLIEDGTMSSKIAKKVFPELAENGGDAKQIMEDKGLVQISDEATLLKFVNEALDNNPQSVEDYKMVKESDGLLSWTNYESFKRPSKSSKSKWLIKTRTR